MTGISYATSAEMAKELGPFPGYKKNRERDAARDAQPPPRRLWRAHRLRAGGDAAGPARRQGLPRPGAGRARQARLGPRGRARHPLRLPQCAGLGGGADRHHRPGDGLRHHRHRARLRAGEVQEARRRRLLQDHQPRGAGSAARARLLAGAKSPRSRPMPSATARSARRPASTTRRSRPRASPTRRSPSSRRRCRPRSTSSSRSTSGRWASRSWSTSSASTRPSSTIRSSTCSPRSASPSARSTPPTSTSAAR